MSKLKMMAASLSLALVLGACATATPYKAAKGLNDAGYSETRIEPGKYRVNFKGNTSTDLATVENYILLRAAELTKSEGLGHFTILDEGDSTTSTFRSTSTGFGGSRFGGRRFGSFGGGFGGGFGSGTTSTRERQEIEMNVVVQGFPGLKAEENFQAFNAQAVIDNLSLVAER